jgi:hypothetical protein
MDLRDRFAVRFAASLVGAVADPADLARRAYDLAEAMLAERARRIDADEARAIAGEPHRASLAPPEGHPYLLDEPAPMIEPDLLYDEALDPSWLDPSWDLETRWSAEPAPASQEPGGPGLARTRPDGEEALKKRSA